MQSNSTNNMDNTNYYHQMLQQFTIQNYFNFSLSSDQNYNHIMPEFEKEDEFFQTSEVHQNKNALENAVSVHSKKLLHKFPSKFFVFPSGDEPQDDTNRTMDTEQEPRRYQRKTDQNRYKKIYSLMHKILKKLQLQHYIRKHKDERYRLDYFACILIELRYVGGLQAFEQVYLQMIQRAMYELEAKKEELKEEEKMLLKCESFIKSIENTLKYLQQFKKGNQVDGVSILFDKDLKNSKFIDKSKKRVGQLLSRKREKWSEQMI